MSNKALRITAKALLVAVYGGFTMTSASAETGCSTLFDFSQPSAVSQWRSVNDNVMGGRSRGGPSVVADGLLFSGSINTNGGGFSSLRASLDIGSLGGMDAIRLEWQPDARRYQLSIQTNVRFRGRPVAYRADIRRLSVGDWSRPTVFFSELKPTVFGQRVRAPAFDPSRASSISLFINDGQDGPFRVAVRTISGCSL
ncbi:MAG: CIA30 family protein [Pseudomonadota bacterium]